MSRPRRPRRSSGKLRAIPPRPPGEPIYSGTLKLAGHPLQFDGFGADGLTFVSHAHVNLPRDTGRLIATPQTARLLGSRARGALTAPYRHPFSLGTLELRLLPSGHVPGSAALEVRSSGRTLVYAGELGGAGVLAGLPGPQPARCDDLVLATTYGDPRFQFPPPAEALAEVLAFCRATLARGIHPVLACEPLGKAQWLGAQLQEAGLGVRLHRSMHLKLRQLAKDLPEQEPTPRYELELPPGEVLIWPPTLLDAPTLTRIGKRRIALVSGRAQQPGIRRRLGVDAAIALSDHADFGALLSYVSAADPKRVFLLPGREKALGRALRAEGRDVSVLGPPAQLALFD